MRVGQSRKVFGVAAIAACGLVLAGCESGRFGGGPRASLAARAPDPLPDPVTPAVPSGSVTAEPLGPPPGASPSQPPVMPGSPQAVEVFGAPVAAPVAPAGSRSAAVGAWTAREATGASCRVTLSSTPSLDLYRASASGCPNKDLARVTAWDFRDGEVYLYQPGGAVAARLRSGEGGLSGVLSRSGAPLSLTRG